MSNARTGSGRSGWLALVGQVLLLLLAVAAPARASTVTDILAEAGAGNLSYEECAQLSQALTDANFSAKWSEIGTALRVNWDDTTMSAWDQVSAVQAVAASLTAQQKPLMAAAIYELYSPRGDVLKQLNSGESEELIKLLFALGGGVKAADLLGDWLAATDVWKTKANVDQLTQLLRILQTARSEAAATQRAAVAKVAWDKYLAAGAPDAGTATFAQKVRLISSASAALTAQQVADLGPRLVGWLKDSTILAAATVIDIRVCESLPPAFGVAAEYPEIAAAWVAASEQWKKLAEENLVVLAVAVSSAKSESAQQQKGKLPALFFDKYFGANPEKLPFDKAINLSRRMFPLLSSEKQRQMVDKLASSSGEATTISDLTVLAALMEEAQRVAKDKGYSEFAGALARVLKTGATNGYPRLLALPLGTAQVRAIVSAELIDPAGTVRLNVASVLAFAYREYETLQAWQKLIDQKLSDSSITGDRKASWLLARAGAESAKPGTVSPLGGKEWLDQALAVSTSDSMKLRCLETLALGYVGVLQAQEANKLLDQAAGQFSSPESQAKVEEIRKQCQKLAEDIRLVDQAARAAATQRAKTDYIAEIELRLAEARRKGDQGAIGRLEQLLADIKK